MQRDINRQPQQTVRRCYSDEENDRVLAGRKSRARYGHSDQLKSVRMVDTTEGTHPPVVITRRRFRDQDRHDRRLVRLDDEIKYVPTLRSRHKQIAPNQGATIVYNRRRHRDSDVETLSDDCDYQTTGLLPDNDDVTKTQQQNGRLRHRPVSSTMTTQTVTGMVTTGSGSAARVRSYTPSAVKSQRLDEVNKRVINNTPAKRRRILSDLINNGDAHYRCESSANSDSNTDSDEQQHELRACHRRNPPEIHSTTRRRLSPTGNGNHRRHRCKNRRHISDSSGDDYNDLPTHASGRHLYDSDAPTSDRKRRPMLKPDKFDGSGNVDTYLRKFENCATYNQWDSIDKCAFLKASLTGGAEALMLTPENINYDDIVTKLRLRYGTSDQREKHRTELRYRRRRSGETLQSCHRT